jgi:hypothetical protein
MALARLTFVSADERTAKGNEVTPTTGDRWKLASRILRISLIGIMLIGGLFSLVILNYQVCEPSTIESATGTACRSPNLSDSVTLVFFAVVIALLWPDIAEFGIFGVSVKRKVEQALQQATTAQQVAERAADQVLLQSVRLEQVSTSSASSSSETKIFADFGSQELRAAVDQLSNKLNAFERGVPYQDERVYPSELNDQLVGKVIRLWSELTQRLSLDSSDLMRGRKSPEWLLVDERRPDKQRFIESFMSELKLIRAVRNSAAHSISLSRESLQEAIAVAEGLISALQKQEL